tara:strand:+ start:1855 stop:2097 length:243 start_codon:yes stop_codon:yes gene_type:complete
LFRRRAEVTQENVRSGEANEEGNEEEAQENEAQFSGKLGKKKLEKLKKKEEKRAQREALLEMQAQVCLRNHLSGSERRRR